MDRGGIGWTADTADAAQRRLSTVFSPTSSFFCLISDEPSSPVRLIHCNCLGYLRRDQSFQYSD